MSEHGTIDAYDLYYEVYDAETRDFWEKFPEEIIRTFATLLPGKRVLDLGSGPGRDADLLRKHGLSVICADGSPNMVELTRSHGFESVVCDMRDLHFEDGSFDGVWAYSSIIHVTRDDARKIVRKISRLLKPSGVFMLAVIEGNGSESIGIAGSNIKRYFEYYSAEKMESLMEGTDFRLVKSEKFQPGHHVYLNNTYRKI